MDESSGSGMRTKQGIMDVASNSQIQKKSVHDRESTSDPDVLKDIHSVGPGLVV